MPMIKTGEVLTSATGRIMSSAPKIDCTTERKITLTLARVNVWLRHEAIQESISRNNTLAEQQFRALPIDGKKYTPADLDALNLYLWDTL